MKTASSLTHASAVDLTMTNVTTNAPIGARPTATLPITVVGP